MKEGAFGAYINAAYRQHSLRWLTPPPLPRCEACHWILSRPRAPYGTAITDSLDSQVAPAPLRIQFAGVTPVPLPPPYSGGTMGAGRWRQFEFMAAAERKPYNRASPGGKQANRPVGRLKCTPSAAYRRRLSTGKRLTKFSVAFRLPTNFVRLPPRRGRF